MTGATGEGHGGGKPGKGRDGGSATQPDGCLWTRQTAHPWPLRLCIHFFLTAGGAGQPQLISRDWFGLPEN